MYNKKFTVIALLLVVVIFSVGVVYSNNQNSPDVSWKDKTSFCDSMTIQQGYEGEAICYEAPENPYVKQNLVRLER